MDPSCFVSDVQAGGSIISAQDISLVHFGLVNTH